MATGTEKDEKVVTITKSFIIDNMTLKKYYEYNDRIFYITRNNMDTIYVQSGIFRVKISLDYRNNKYIVDDSHISTKCNDIKDAVNKACDVITNRLFEKKKASDLRKGMNNFIEGLSDYAS